MSLFRCESCGCVDSLPIAYDGRNPRPNEKLLCTACQGRPWHGYFTKESYSPQKHVVINDARLKMD